MVTSINTTVAKMMSSAGTTRAGAYSKIWVIYTKEKTVVRPVLSTVDTIMEQSEGMYLARAERSPEEYFLKKSAGRDKTRIMVAACTETDSFVSMRFISRVLMASTNSVLTVTLIINTVMPRSS